MNNETWANFAESIFQSLTKDNIEVDSPIIDTISLNKLWHKLNLAIKVALTCTYPLLSSPHNPTLLCTTQDQIISWIIKTTQKKYKILVMGNFNCDTNKKKNKLPLFHHMGNCNLTSTLNFFDITQHTWSRRTSHSQIDDI